MQDREHDKNAHLKKHIQTHAHRHRIIFSNRCHKQNVSKGTTYADLSNLKPVRLWCNCCTRAQLLISSTSLCTFSCQSVGQH